jgi:UDP-N-acetylglucosamine--N-acetylmuramyl-(pentapeptide) pyrophosphoryl-undecaprenol N-acetylglucosamine transferase
VYPALAIAQALPDIIPDADVTWIGTLDGMEGDLIRREGIRFVGIPGGGLHGVALLNAVRNGWDLVRAIFVARHMLRTERPGAILTTGGFVSGPVAMAARLEGVPMLVYVPDIEPAGSVKAISRLAQQVAVTVPDSGTYFPDGKAVVTGYPLGERITRWTREGARAEAREALGLAPVAEGGARDPVLLVFGGSRGARSINRALLGGLQALTELAEVVHVSGTLDWSEIEATLEDLPADVRARYHAFPYLHERMGAAMAAADLVICRSGASVLGEFPHFGLPAILVPYPYAWRYQRVNAGWLEERGAAVVVEDAELAAAVVPTVRDLLADWSAGAESGRLHAMAEAARQLARPDAAARAAQLLVAMGRDHQDAQGQG